jgi:hypothetical protein
MEYCNGLWLDINSVSDELNEKFSRGLYALKIPGRQVWFDKLDCKVGMARQKQKDMTIDDFFALDRRPFPGLSLTIGRTENFGKGWEQTVSFAWRIVMDSRVDYFYWFVSRYDDAIIPVSKLFENVYGQYIFSFPRLG